MTSIKSVLFGIYFTLAGLPAASADINKKSLDISDVMLGRSFQIQGQNMAVSPDGSSLLTTLCDAKKISVAKSDSGRMAMVDGAYRSMGCDLWRYELKGGVGIDLTQGLGNNWSPAWSPDGTKIAFISDRTGKPQLWLMDARTGKSDRVGDVRTRQWLGYEVPMWLDDGIRVVVKLRPASAIDAQDPSAVMLSGAQQEEVYPESSVVVFRSPAKPHTATPPKSLATDTTLADLAVVDTKTGAVRVLRQNAPIRSQRLSPDRKQLAIMETNPAAQVDPNAYELSVIDIASGQRRVVASNVSQGFVGAVSFSPDGRRLAYFATDIQGRKAMRAAGTDSSLDLGGGDLYVWDATTGNVAKASGIPTNRLKDDVLPPLWTAGGDRLYLSGTDRRIWVYEISSGLGHQLPGAYPEIGMVLARAGSEVVATDPTGRSLYASYAKPKESTNGLAKIDALTGKVQGKFEGRRVFGSVFDPPILVQQSQRILFKAQSASEGDDLWVTDSRLSATTRLTTANPQLDQYRFGKSQSIAFTAASGMPLHAGVLLPSNYRPGKRYPLLVWVYASNADTSKSVNRFGLVGMDAFNMQMLATRGYAVMFPEIPTHRGTPVQDLLDAVNPAIDRLVELGVADSERVAVMGNSNGGYSTLALITRTDRFKAAVMNSGFGDLGAFYGTMGGGWIPWLEDNGGSMGVAPWQAPEQYVRNSPFYALDKINTPLLIQAGASDHGIIQHSDQVWVGMNKLKKETIYLRYGGESHVLAGAANLQDYWQRVLKFLDEHLKTAKAAKVAQTSVKEP